MRILSRDIPPRSCWALEQAGIHPLLARLYAARGVHDTAELDDSLAQLLPSAPLAGSEQAARLLDMVQGREAHLFDRAVDNQISRLRRKIEVDSRNPQLIQTVWGGGYMLAAEVRRRPARG